jgi:low temperature requirement protein LtrA
MTDDEVDDGAAEAGAFGDTRWPLVPAHFAERHYLVVILALGESIVALGAGAEVELTAAVVGSAALGIALTAALWWTYYDVVAIVTRRRLEQSTEGRQRMILARDAYSYLHFPMVAGIVLIALGLEETLHHVDDPLDRVHALALLGGTALYLLAHVALRLRTAGTINFQRLVLASLLLAAVPIAVHVASLVALGGMTAVLWLLISYETLFVYDERRYRLRHGLDTEIPIRRS